MSEEVDRPTCESGDGGLWFGLILSSTLRSRLLLESRG